MLLGATLLLTATAWQRGAEYDEQYTLYLTRRVARPVWPSGMITAGQIRALQQPEADAAGIARDLLATDVHPPLNFWVIAGWRRMVGDSLFAAAWRRWRAASPRWVWSRRSRGPPAFPRYRRCC